MYLRVIRTVLVSMEGPGFVIFVDRAELCAEDKWYHSYVHRYWYMHSHTLYTYITPVTQIYVHVHIDLTYLGYAYNIDR